MKAELLFYVLPSKTFHYKMVMQMKENKLVTMSMDLSVKIIHFCGTIKGHYALTNQLERAGTSIGANIHEANYAHSRADFISKLQIALKESYETEYWLKIFILSGLSDDETANPLRDLCGKIRHTLIASINTAKHAAGVQ